MATKMFCDWCAKEIPVISRTDLARYEFRIARVSAHVTMRHKDYSEVCKECVFQFDEFVKLIMSDNV